MLFTKPGRWGEKVYITEGAMCPCSPCRGIQLTAPEMNHTSYQAQTSVGNSSLSLPSYCCFPPLPVYVSKHRSSNTHVGKANSVPAALTVLHVWILLNFCD